MSKPPQTTGEPASRTLSSPTKNMGGLVGFGFALGTVMTLLFYYPIQLYILADKPIWPYYLLPGTVVVLSALMFRCGRNWSLSTQTAPMTVLIYVVVGGLVPVNMMRLVGFSPYESFAVALYSVALVVFLVVLTRAVRKLRDRDQKAWAGVLSVASVYVFFSLLYLLLSLGGNYGDEWPHFGFVSFFAISDHYPDVVGNHVLAVVLPLTTFVLGRAFRTTPEDAQTRSGSPEETRCPTCGTRAAGLTLTWR